MALPYFVVVVVVVVVVAVVAVAVVVVSVDVNTPRLCLLPLLPSLLPQVFQ